jgi:ornithine cyclodeaminase
MHILSLDEIRRRIDDIAVINRMREAMMAHSRGECQTPMPMHLNIGTGEIHVKSSYRGGGEYFALKMASTFSGVGNGMILLGDAATGKPIVYLDDGGHLTDVRTAAVAAMVARELRRTDRSMGIIGSGIQARLTARLHARVLPLEHIYLSGRTPERVAKCADDIRASLPNVAVTVLDSRADVAHSTRLIVTCTAARAPLLWARDIQPGTLISAVGADAPGKQELDPALMRQAALLLVDSLTQCQKLGELQHVPDQAQRAMEIGAHAHAVEGSHGSVSRHARHVDPAGVTIADFTGLGVEDLYIAELIHENANI